MTVCLWIVNIEFTGTVTQLSAPRQPGEPTPRASSVQPTSLKRQRLARNKHDIGTLVPPLHLVINLPLLTPRRILLLPPTRPRREKQTRRLVRPTTHIPRTNHTMPIRNREIQQTPRILLNPLLPHHLPNQRIDPLNRLQQRLPQHRVPEPLRSVLLTVGRIPHAIQTVQEHRERPFAVRAALHVAEPLVLQARGQTSLHQLPAPDAAVVHPHQAAVPEGVAVLLAQVALRRGAHVRKNEGGGCFGGEARQVDAVPGGDGGGEDARLWAQEGRGVVADAEPVAVVGAAVVLGELVKGRVEGEGGRETYYAEAGVEGLVEDAVGGFEDEL